MRFQLSLRVYRGRWHRKLLPLMLFSHWVFSKTLFLNCVSLFRVRKIFYINTSQNKQKLKAGKLNFLHINRMLIQGEHHHIVMDFIYGT